MSKKKAIKATKYQSSSSGSKDNFCIEFCLFPPFMPPLITLDRREYGGMHTAHPLWVMFLGEKGRGNPTKQLWTNISEKCQN
jgi:hypothetical protein